MRAIVGVEKIGWGIGNWPQQVENPNGNYLWGSLKI